ncbi:FAD:protein FMN transferase [bacterium]|nr:FAD:protein FMN transferase [bacterium]
MALFEKVLEAKVMSTKLLIRANVSKSILLRAYTLAKDFEERYSAYKENSFLNKINSLAGLNWVDCKSEDIELFQRCLEASRQSEGGFDISIGALSHGAYHFGFSNQEIATKELLNKQKVLVDFNLIHLSPSAIFLTKKGMRLDLGGIGKGYVAKKIILFLKQNGATKALVDVGGEIVSFGKSYNIAIKDPFSEANIGYIKTSREPISISTSGDYERFISSKENNHILNKSNGISANIYSSMTVIQNGFDIDMLDAFATAMFNKNLDYVKSFSKRLNFATISIDKESNISLCNNRDLKLNSLELTYL